LPHVTSIFISAGPDLSLSGTLPDDFAVSPPVLQKLQVSGHKLTGRLPQSLFKSVALQSVDFHSNELQGRIAEAISNLLYLAYFSVANNKMFGPLPASMKALTKLSTLGLAENSFTGPIDPIADLPNLIILFLRHNLFDGVIPLLASSVAVFDMDFNQFTSVAPGLCYNKNSMAALKNFGGCSTDWPGQASGTCCIANNKLNDSTKLSCPKLANCFPAGTMTYDCHILTDQCVPVSGQGGEFPTLQGCKSKCSKVPTPAPPLTCTGQSSDLTRTDCAAWVAFANDPHFKATLIAKCPTAVLDPCACTFYDHVECANGRITHLSMYNESLTGLFPASLLKLTGLTYM
jgi:hypothetical protein